MATIVLDIVKSIEPELTEGYILCATRTAGVRYHYLPQTHTPNPVSLRSAIKHRGEYEGLQKTRNALAHRARHREGIHISHFNVEKLSLL